jgi:phosphatidylglycerophosphatase A
VSSAVPPELLRRARTAHPVAFWLAVWFGCGLVPLAPGTAGTLGAVPLYLALRAHGPVPLAIAALAVTLVGFWAAGRMAELTGQKDPQIVVIDEVAGVLVTWLAAPPTTTGLVLGFVLFRVFDQLKPFPAGLCERKLPPALGIVLDDLFAGAWGALALLAARHLGWL